jgi:hypothetical protein
MPQFSPASPRRSDDLTRGTAICGQPRSAREYGSSHDVTRRVSFVSHRDLSRLVAVSSNHVIFNRLWRDDGSPDDVGPESVERRPISERCNALLSKGLSGWEAGIRTPITWSRERRMGCGPRRFASVCSSLRRYRFRVFRSVLLCSRTRCLIVSRAMGSAFVLPSDGLDSQLDARRIRDLPDVRLVRGHHGMPPSDRAFDDRHVDDVIVRGSAG